MSKSTKAQIRKSLKDGGGELTRAMTSALEIFPPRRSCEWCQTVQTLIHFLGPFWCQKMNRLCIWSFVINSWIRSIPRTEMNQPEQWIKTSFLSSLLEATGIAFFFCLFVFFLTNSTYLFLAWEYPSAITVVTCLWAFDEVWEHSTIEGKSLLN